VEIPAEPIHLIDRITGERIDASLYSFDGEEAFGFDNFLLRSTSTILSQWQPFFRCFRKPELDAKWEYLGILGGRFHTTSDKRELAISILISDGLVEGLMVTGPSKPAHLKDSRSKRLLYLANMSTAPWNRRNLLVPCEDRSLPIHPANGAGTILLKKAIHLSQAAGLGGRIGLRAMGTSWRFYKKRGFENLGKIDQNDEYSGQSWWELSESRSRSVLAGR